MLETRFTPSPEGGRAEILIPVNGVPTWRAAMCNLCVGYPSALVPRSRWEPILEDGECLRETYDGRMEIVRARP